MRTGQRACVVGVALLLALLAAPPAASLPMASGPDSRDTGYLPLFNYTSVEVRPGDAGAVSLTVTNRYDQTMYSLQVDLAFQVGGEWRTARPIDEIAAPPQFTPTAPRVPHDLAAGASVTFTVPFTTSPDTPEGVYLVTLVARYSYTDATNTTRGAVLKSLGAVAQEGNQSHVDMDHYNATLDALGIDGVAPDSSILVDSHAGEALFWQAVVAGAVVVAAGFGIAEYMARRPGGEKGGRRRRK